MSPRALVLVLTGVVLHATWNLSAKQAADGDNVAFVWLMSLVSTALALPFAVASWAVEPPPLGERPGVAGAIGIAAVLAGIVLVSGLMTAAGRGADRALGVGWGTLTGCGSPRTPSSTPGRSPVSA